MSLSIKCDRAAILSLKFGVEMYICAGSGFLNVEDDIGEVFTVNCPGCDCCVENPDREDNEEYEFYEKERASAYEAEIALHKEEANEPEYVPFWEC